MTPLELILGTLGQMTPDEIAEWLADNHVLGTRYNSRSCPISVLLNRGENDDAEWVTTGLHTRRRPRNGVYEFPIDLPVSVSTFIQWFDNGLYPDIDKWHEETS